MKTISYRFAGWLLILPLVSSCNLYSGFQGDSTDQDHLEMAQKFEANNDYPSAIAEYKQLTPGDQQELKLCMANLGLAGFTLPALVNVFSNNPSAHSLGVLANQLLPYTTVKQQAADDAKTHCTKYLNNVVQEGATGNALNLGALINTLGVVVHAATLLAKTTVFQGVDDADTTGCGTPSKGFTDQVAPSNITTLGGQVNASHPGMCAPDAATFLADLLAINSSTLQNAGLNDLLSFFNNLPPELKSQATAVIIRGGIIQTLAN